MKPLKNVCVVLACASLLLGQFGCETTASAVLSSAQFDSSAYKTDKEIKAEAVALIARAKNHTPYTDVAADVDQLMTKVDQAIATEQKRPKNDPTVAQWKKIKTQLSNTFNLWKSKGSCSPAFAEDIGSQIGGLFDILIKTENDKPKQA
jgi:hypothetical protein